MTHVLRSRSALALFCFVLLWTSRVPAQTDVQAVELGSPQVIFELDWPQADPHWYQVAVDQQGHALYKSQPNVAEGESQDEPYIQQFTISPKTTAQIFQLADSLGHFKGSFDYKGSVRMAQTGVKTLHYESSSDTQSTTFNWSENKQVMELADLFQGLSLTIESGMQLRHAQRFDKLGVDAILKRLEELNRDHRLVEIQAIAPILQRVANDMQCMNIARQRAKRLLASAEAER